MILNIIIPERLIGERIDVAMVQMLPDYSRSKIVAWIKSGDAQIKRKNFKAKEKVQGGEVISLRVKPLKTTAWQAQNMPIDVVYEDEDIIIINKPVGLITHPGAGNANDTLANRLLHYQPNLAQLDRAGIVHRLDKNTSGLMVVARNKLAQKHLSQQLQTHSISREYSAVVYGYMIAGGSVDAAIGRDPKERIKQAVIASGKPSKTHYRVIQRFAHHTHVKAILETGRTHQIRVHMAHIKHPLIADFIYGGKVRFPKKAPEPLKIALKNFKRQALHAKKLTLIHPVSEKQMTYKSALPEDLQALLETLSQFDSL